MKLLRPYLGLVLCLLLTVTSQTMAVARGTPSPTGQMVLCTGTGPITVLVNAAGQPTGAVHICPDLALAFFVTLGDTTTDLSYLAEGTEPHLSDIIIETRQYTLSAFQARAPPGIA